ncbi:MAG: cobalamin-binding protein [Thermoplasmata archaeon]|jgi:iron complex transport system substrate-binding protein
MRVISVLPSATEIVCALGHGSELVARSSECDFPPEVRGLPAVMRPRTWDSERASRQIDDRVRRARGANESLYELDVEALRTLRPDLLLTQDLCGVCSVTPEEVTSACELAGVRPLIVSLTPTNLTEVWDTVEKVGSALGDDAAGTELARSLRSRTRPRPRTGRKVVIVEWLDPPILAGLWTPDLVTAAGGEPLGPSSARPGARTTWKEVARLSPDLIIVSPCSFSVARTNRELDASASLRAEVLATRPPLGLYVADEAYFSRPGPRLADGAELVRTLLERGAPVGPMPVELLLPRSPGVTV